MVTMDDFSSIVTAELFEKYVSDFYSESNPQILLYGHVYSQYLKHKGSVRSLSLTICQDPTQVKSCSVKISDLNKKVKAGRKFIKTQRKERQEMFEKLQMPFDVISTTKSKMAKSSFDVTTQ
jgi:hypothetical protein